MSKILCAMAALLFLTTMRASAHHAFAVTYDGRRLVTVSGVVTKFEWTNPHVWLSVDGKDDSGKVGIWKFEMGSPGGLVSRGWEKAAAAVKRGDRVTVDGYPAKDGTNVANARMVTLPGGQKLFGGFQETPRDPVK
jgi:hypothetical protein